MGRKRRKGEGGLRGTKWASEEMREWEGWMGEWEGWMGEWEG